MSRLRSCLFAATLFWSPLLLNGQTAASSSTQAPALPAEITFQFVRVGLAVPRFTLRIHENGTGRYQADQAARSPTGAAARGEAAQQVDRTFTLPSATAEKIFHAAHAADRFNITCASKAKNIADTGVKTLSYSGEDGSGSCVYNYTENKVVAMLTDTFIGIAATMDEGRRLEFLHRYDRLGLDAEMELLAQEAQAGRALDLGTISETLSSIADDTAVIQRARLRAGRLLAVAREGR